LQNMKSTFLLVLLPLVAGGCISGPGGPCTYEDREYPCEIQAEAAGLDDHGREIIDVQVGAGPRAAPSEAILTQRYGGPNLDAVRAALAEEPELICVETYITSGTCAPYHVSVEGLPDPNLGWQTQ